MNPSYFSGILLVTLSVLLSFCPQNVDGHGFMLYPMQRGTLAGNNIVKVPPFDKKAPFDHRPHFPSGDKRANPGAAKRSQIKAGGGKYTTFRPMEPGFRWRAGVCGDAKSGPTAGDHVIGGKYYYGGKIVATFKRNSVMEMEIAVVAHHKGYIEAHVCDVDKKYCPSGDLSEKCFTKKNCVQLQRVANKECDSGYSTSCGPIDKKYPGRWFLPCENKNVKTDVYGRRGEIKYRIPARTCKHCVLHWAWIAANGCHPEGVSEYFNGSFRPRKWDSCPGNNKGGFSGPKKACAGSSFPEEYYQCADISIV